MGIKNYLPSEQFGAMLGALLISSGLITAASGVMPFNSKESARLYASQTAAADLSDANPTWEQAFAGNTVAQDMAAIQNQADQLTAGIKSKNLTDTVSKSLLLQYGSLQGQGIAGNADAQAQVVQTALAQVQNAQTLTPTYTRYDLKIIDSTKDTLHTWGNELPQVIFAHRTADENIALLLFGTAVDTNNKSTLARLSATAAEYRALSRDTARLPVPSLLAVYQLQLTNNYALMAAAIGNMQQVLSDPMRGLLGLQTFVQLAYGNAQTLLQINSLLKQGGIVFASSEPGAAWASYTAQTVANSAKLQAAIQSGISQ